MLKKEFKIAKKQAGGDSDKDSDDDVYKEVNKEQTKIMKAVKGISFSLKKNECFILLGVNGAGKSTTFKCLTLDEDLSSGNIHIGGESIRKLFGKPEAIQFALGYCPQTNPLINGYTVKESLMYFAALKGLPEE